MIAKLENKLQFMEEDAKKLTERAEKAESEIEFLKQDILKLTGEKEAAALQLQQCLETISILEHVSLCAKEEAQRLNAEINEGVAKLEDGSAKSRATEKAEGTGNARTCVQEEQPEPVQVLKDLENHNQTLQGEIQKVKEENKNLSEINVSSAISMRDMQNEVSSLSEAKGKLEVEVELRMDQRNALQQEIYCLKEELNDHNKKLLSIVTQVQAVGLDPECFESSVKELQDDKSNLGKTCERERSEKVAFREATSI
ncbi:hypothetical protein HAX54_003816 [Datura stramonium]|uniref:Uncharacterized protein n=1 Tax=Datura stramonium TaxID=4076 RepID=A0ABS8T5X8_DATST|nr:hypothetical protein [Datura stramonium]